MGCTYRHPPQIKFCNFDKRAGKKEYLSILGLVFDETQEYIILNKSSLMIDVVYCFIKLKFEEENVFTL